MNLDRQPISRIFVIISTPSIRGIFTSVTIISGDRRPAMDTPSSPLGASPTITHPRAARFSARIAISGIWLILAFHLMVSSVFIETMGIQLGLVQLQWGLIIWFHYTFFHLIFLHFFCYPELLYIFYLFLLIYISILHTPSAIHMNLPH